MRQLIIAATLLTSLGADATGLPCSIHPKKGIANADLPALATVTQADAESTALKAVNVSSASVASGELEAEGGCLIYSFDIQIPGKKSIVEVAVDAGTGKVLAQKHESPKAQAAEKAADAAAAKTKKSNTD
jgi:Peptidase propeptide and YPEB domain